MTKLQDIVPAGTKENPIITDKGVIYDKEIEITNITFLSDDGREYARVIFNYVGSTEFHALLTGSSYVLPKLHAVVAADQYPVQCTLKKIGNADTLE